MRWCAKFGQCIRPTELTAAGSPLKAAWRSQAETVTQQDDGLADVTDRSLFFRASTDAL